MKALLGSGSMSIQELCDKAKEATDEAITEYPGIARADGEENEGDN